MKALMGIMDGRVVSLDFLADEMHNVAFAGCLEGRAMPRDFPKIVAA